MQTSVQLPEDPWIGVPAVSQPTHSSPSAFAYRTPTPQREMRHLIQREIKSRLGRAKLFQGALSSDPAWDILLDLFAAEHDGRRVQVTGVGAPARIPTATAIRWLIALENKGLLCRKGDPLDRRRCFIRLTNKGCELMAQYFERQLILTIHSGVFTRFSS